jgi:3D (Asp-Asp-Asp) domain-containing protein
VKDEDRMLLTFGWGAIMIAIILLICRVTYRTDELSKKIDKTIMMLNEQQRQATATDATASEPLPEEPEEVKVEILEQYKRAEVKTATPTEAETTEEEPMRNYMDCYELTAYIATGNPCADGEYPHSGFTAACNDPRLWHKTVYINGYGTFYIHDTGGVASNVIDIFVDSYDEAIQFGRRSADVYLEE